MPELPKILVVDDEGIIAMSLQHKLNSLGYDVPETAGSGEEAIDLAAELCPDLVLMDIRLNGTMDGIEAAGHIRQKCGSPVVFLSAFSDEETLQRAKLTDPFGYILKPVVDRELRIVVEMALYRSRTERVLQLSEKKFRAVIETASDAVISSDSRGRITFFNTAAERMFGYSAAEAAGMSVAGLMPERFHAAHAREMAGFISTSDKPGGGRAVEWVGLRKGGAKIPIEVSVSSWESLDGKHFTAIIRDITERIRAENELKHSRDHLEDIVRERTAQLEERNRSLALEIIDRQRAEQVVKLYEFIANSIQDPIGLIDRNLIYLAVNDAFCNALRKPREALVNKLFGDIWGAELCEKHLKPCLLRCFDGGAESIRIWMELGTFGRRYCSVSFYPYRGLDNTITHAVVLIRDVTTENEAERELIDARNAAQGANKAKSWFLANMSHEIRTPLNGVLGLGFLLAQTQLTLKQRDYVSKIEFSAQNLMRIINDILDFSKVEAGKIELESVEFSPDKVLADLIQMTSLQAQQRNLNLKFNLSPDMPPVLLGDPLRLGQVLLNLTGNAIKFTQQGEVEIVLEVVSRDILSATLRFTVKDTGIGMTETQMSRLFEPFSQADSTTTRKFGGSGLGLTISRSYVRLMGGDIAIESAVGAGTSFSFELKFKLPARTPSQTFAALSTRRRALIVDGNQATRLTLTNLLRHFSCDAVSVSSGEDAVIEIKRQLPSETSPMYHVVLVDEAAAGIGALETARQIRSQCRDGNSPRLILMLSKASDALQRQAEAAGFNAILSKPATRSNINTAILLAQERKPLRFETTEVNDLTTSLPDACLQGANILLVDDNEVNQQIAGELLKMAGCRVVIASSGAEALRVLFDNSNILKFDAVLMDVQMPTMDGNAATVQIRTEPRFAKLPVIAMTAEANAGAREKCLAAGMNDFLSKPVNVRDLYLMLARWVGTN